MASLSTSPGPKINHVTFPCGTTMILPCSLSRILPKMKRYMTCSTFRVHSTATRNSEPSSTLPISWREIQGENDWEGLVEPLDPVLRHEIIRYGEFVAACYKAFDLDHSSKRYFNCKYRKMNMLREVGLRGSGYNITKYIYATPDVNNIPIQNAMSDCGRWIGYVAVSSDEEVKRLGRRDVVIAFRGTITIQEWIVNFMSSLTPARLDPNDYRPDVQVQAGFLNLYTSDEISSLNKGIGLKSCREQLLSEVSHLLKTYKGEQLSITLAGHSLGSSLALILAYDIAELGLNRSNKYSNQERVPITVFSFAGPRVGNYIFKQRCDELGVKVLRVVNVNDPITKLPGVILNEDSRVILDGNYEFNPLSTSCYAHVGVEIVIDFFKVENPLSVHDLESYINMFKCPKELRMQRGEKHFGERAKYLLLSVQTFIIFPWIIAACSMANFVKSQVARI